MTRPTPHHRLALPDQLLRQPAPAAPVDPAYLCFPVETSRLPWYPGSPISPATLWAISQISQAGSHKKPTLYPNPPLHPPHAAVAGAAAGEALLAPVPALVQAVLVPVLVVGDSRDEH